MAEYAVEASSKDASERLALTDGRNAERFGSLEDKVDHHWGSMVESTDSIADRLDNADHQIVAISNEVGMVSNNQVSILHQIEVIQRLNSEAQSNNESQSKNIQMLF